MNLNELITNSIEDLDVIDDTPIYLKSKSKSIEKVKEPNRNDKCPCGSGLKYKKCCMDISRDIINKLNNWKDGCGK